MSITSIWGVEFNMTSKEAEFYDTESFRRLKHICERECKANTTFVEFGYTHGMLSLILLHNEIITEGKLLLLDDSKVMPLVEIAARNHKLNLNLCKRVEEKGAEFVALSGYIDIASFKEFIEIDMTDVDVILIHSDVHTHLNNPLFLIEISDRLKAKSFEISLGDCSFSTYVFKKKSGDTN